MKKKGMWIDTPAYGGRVTIHFHPTKHYYLVSVPELGVERVYQPGVTSIIGMKDKSGPLTWWTAETCELYLKLAVDGLRREVEIGGGRLEVVSIEWLLQQAGLMKRNYRNVKQQAAEIGTIVHDYLHQHLEWVHFGAISPVRPHLSQEIVATHTKEQIDKANNSIDAGLKFFTDHDLKPLTMEKSVWSAEWGYVGTDDFIGYVDGELCVNDYKTSKRLYPEIWMQTAAYQVAYCEENPKAKIKARWGINVGKEDGALNAVRRGNEHLEKDFKGFLGFRDGYMWDRTDGYEPKEAIEIVGALPPLQKRGSRKAVVDSITVPPVEISPELRA